MAVANPKAIKEGKKLPTYRKFDKALATFTIGRV